VFDDEVNQLLLSDCLSIVKENRSNAIPLQYILHCAKIFLIQEKFLLAFKLSSKCFRYSFLGEYIDIVETSLAILNGSYCNEVEAYLSRKKLYNLVCCIRGIKQYKKVVELELRLFDKMLDIDLYANAQSCLFLMNGARKDGIYCFELKRSVLMYMIKAFRFSDDYIKSILSGHYFINNLSYYFKMENTSQFILC
jgi:hypothetical protein